MADSEALEQTEKNWSEGRIQPPEEVVNPRAVEVETTVVTVDGDPKLVRETTVNRRGPDLKIQILVVEGGVEVAGDGSGGAVVEAGAEAAVEIIGRKGSGLTDGEKGPEEEFALESDQSHIWDFGSPKTICSDGGQNSGSEGGSSTDRVYAVERGGAMASDNERRRPDRIPDLDSNNAYLSSAKESMRVGGRVAGDFVGELAGDRKGGGDGPGGKNEKSSGNEKGGGGRVDRGEKVIKLGFDDIAAEVPRGGHNCLPSKNSNSEGSKEKKGGGLDLYTGIDGILVKVPKIEEDWLVAKVTKEGLSQKEVGGAGDSPQTICTGGSKSSGGSATDQGGVFDRGGTTMIAVRGLSMVTRASYKVPWRTRFEAAVTVF